MYCSHLVGRFLWYGFGFERQKTEGRIDGKEGLRKRGTPLLKCAHTHASHPHASCPPRPQRLVAALPVPPSAVPGRKSGPKFVPRTPTQ
eukprot:5446408-Amphidinium_carterae.1